MKTTCSFCGTNRIREIVGQYPSGGRKYKDEKEKGWKGRKCPDCVKKAHKEYMRSIRGTKLKSKNCDFCLKIFEQKMTKQRFCSKDCRKKANPWKKLTPI